VNDPGIAERNARAASDRLPEPWSMGHAGFATWHQHKSRLSLPVSSATMTQSGSSEIGGSAALVCTAF